MTGSLLSEASGAFPFFPLPIEIIPSFANPGTRISPPRSGQPVLPSFQGNFGNDLYTMIVKSATLHAHAFGFP